MIFVRFYDIDEIEKDKLKYVVIAAQYQDKWIVVKHKERSTWEIPGGHIEKFEESNEAAKRELFEETGAKDFEIIPVAIYSVSRIDEEESFGQLYYAKIKEIGELPESEIEQVEFVDKLPEDLTYPLIQPILFDKVLSYIN